MALNDSDPTCVSTILDSFKRKPGSNRLDSNIMISNVVTKLDFQDDSSTPLSTTKRKKISEIGDFSSSNEVSESMLLNSPWEMHRLKSEIIDAKAQITTLETRVSQLHALRRELEVVFEAEKNSFLQQQERDRILIHNLEMRVAQLRRRETDVRDEFSYKIRDLEEQKYRLEKSVLSLQKQKTQITEELSEVKQILKEAENRASTCDAELRSLKCELNFNKSQSQIEDQATSNESLQRAENEQLLFDLREANRKLKDLENELETNQEASEIAKSQQHKLLRIPDLEREIEALKCDNRKLRDAVHNKVLLEEEVADLKQKCVSSSEQERRLVQLESQQQILKNELSEWKTLVRDFCTAVPEKDVCSSILRHRIQDLQQSELLLTADLADLKTELKVVREEKSRIETQLARMTQEAGRMKVTHEQQANLIRRWQKKLTLIIGERNSYREQLDSYEKELTVCGSSNQQQISHARLEALEKSLEGYRELVDGLESELAAAAGQGDHKDRAEKLRVLTAERDDLKSENIRLQKQCDELQMKMEEKAVAGNFIPAATKILHLRMNPVANAEQEHNIEIASLRTEVAKLQERVRVLQEGEQDEITSKVDQRLASSSSQEVQELRDQVKSADLMIQRLKEAFKKTSSEFRDCVYQLLGYKVDRLQNKGMFRLSSMYAESPNDYLLFKMENSGTLTLLETQFSASFEELIDLHLRQQQSLPIFLAAITMDLFSRQSMITSLVSTGNDEPIVLD